MTSASSVLQALETRPPNLGETAYERIVDMMLAGDLPAGTVLQERKLAEILDISRTPVREALMRLDAEGLVRRDQGRTVMVRQIYESEMMEILQVRSTLEAEAVVLAVKNISDREIEDLEIAVSQLAAKDSASVEEHGSVDDRLHGMIAEASGNRTLAGIIRDLRRKTRFFNTERLPGRFQPGNSEHLAILDALRARDADAARQAVIDHIGNARQGIINKLQDYGNNS